MAAQDTLLRRTGRWLGRAVSVLFFAFWVSLAWAYMAPMRLLPASANAHLVRYACWLNTHKIPQATCDAEIRDAASGQVGGFGWLRLVVAVAATLFALTLLVREFRRGKQ